MGMINIMSRKFINSKIIMNFVLKYTGKFNFKQSYFNNGL